MIGKNVIESEPIPSSEVKEVLEEFAENNELNYVQNLTFNHLARFKRYSAEDAKEIFEKLQDELGLRSRVAAHIVDLVPEDLADMRLIFAKEPGNTTKEDMEKILEILEQYDYIE
ncbi:MAG: DNA-directed RNA polymerase subunit F [Methanobrevibacter thaueri]|nr:DNA-directed RNA polymerase subunit F [Methanobrevibacter thaueri]